MFISLPVPLLPCCLLGNMCHSVLPPQARPTLGRTQPSPDPKPLLPFHLLPGFTDVSTVSHRNCHNNTTSHLLYSALVHSCKWRSLFHGVISLQGVIFNTQIYERAAYTFPNISPLMQRAVTFLHNLGGTGELISWYSSHRVFLRAACPCVCEGWRWRALKSKPRGELMCQAGLRADVWFTRESYYMSLYTGCSDVWIIFPRLISV